MQTVSKGWENAHKQTILSEGYVEVSLDITDLEVLDDKMSATDNGAIFLSDSSKVVSTVEKSIVPYATLEQNIWVLNGTKEIVPDEEYEDSGYISNTLCDDNGIFNIIPILRVNFTRVYDKAIPGVTITWSKTHEDYATDFKVVAYKGSEIVASKTVANNTSTKSVVFVDISGYDRIEIQVLRWCLPYRRARIEELFIGVNMVYTKSQLFSYSHSQKVDPISTSLPKNEIKFSIDNSDGSYNIYNPNSLSKYLTERQEVKTRYGLKVNNRIEWIKGGRFYLSEWYAQQNGISADFTARDLLEFMNDTYKDTATELTERSLYDLATTILTGADLPINSEWVIDEALKSIYTRSILPDDTRANCLELIANAGRCVIYPDRDGVLHIERITNKREDYKIGYSNSYSKPDTTLSKPLKQITVVSREYDIVDGKVSAVPTDVIIPISDTGEVVVVDNPLVTSIDMATEIGQWIGQYLSSRITLKSSWRPDVRLDALDIITNDHDYGTNEVRVTEVSYTFNGAFRGTSNGRVM